ncbi:hypothetical protein FQA39_LY17231 [Lamprigera yunnana]|nr:hypothetical protein FQA39_LY17231 [Lamprigera yunnana]
MGPRRCYLCNRERSNEISLHKSSTSCSTSEDIDSSRSDHVDIESTPKRKRFSQPRYVGEIKSPHLATQEEQKE